MSKSVPAMLHDAPPEASQPTDYDWAHRIAYLRLLDAAADGADWREVATLVLGLDAAMDPDRAKAIWSAHLARAIWMRDHGYRDYLASPDQSAPG
jgi:Uncharacterized conserved protein (DUF2285)